MATLEKIRSKAALLIIVVGLAMLAFIMGDALNSGSTYFRQSQEKIAEVDGTVIKIQEYQSRVDEMTEMYKMQTGSASIPDEYQTQIRESVFGTMVQDIVLNNATEELGMKVSPEELFDMVQGENISPVLQQMPIFLNPETRTFDKAALLNFLKSIDDATIAAAPAEQQTQLLQARSFWMFWEKNIKRQRLEQKYSTLLAKAVSVNKLEAKDAFDASSVNSDIVYVMQSYSSIPDSTIQVSDAEIKKLYNDRKEFYKQKETKVIKYIPVDIRPSEEDYDAASREIEAVKNELSETANIADIVNESSEVPYMDAFFSSNLLDAEMKQFVESAHPGEMYGPVFDNDKYRLFKLIDKTNAPDSVNVSHIMLVSNGDEAAITARADSLVMVLKNGGDFTELAKTFSADQAAKNGGELGWFTEATALRGVNAEFKNAIFSSSKSEYPIVKSNYGIHIIKVNAKTANVDKYKIADVEMSVSPSSKTFGNIYNQLNQFITKNHDIAKLDTAAKTVGFNLLTNIKITTDNQNLANIKNSRQVIRWAFQHESGDISEIFECEGKFVIAAVQGTIPEGYRPLSSVASSLKSELVNQKKGERIVNDLTAKKLTSIESYSEVMNSKVDSVRFINFSTRRIASIGDEPKLNALVSMAQPNQLSAPVSGNNGVYVFKVVSQNNEARTYDEKTEMKALDAMNAYRLGYYAIQSLVDEAEVEDNRIRFY